MLIHVTSGTSHVKPDLPIELVRALRYTIMPSRVLPDLECWDCESSLELHQPDENRAEQFLATCLDCGRWYALAFTKDDEDLIVLELPDVSQIQTSNPPSRDGKG